MNLRKQNLIDHKHLKTKKLNLDYQISAKFVLNSHQLKEYSMKNFNYIIRSSIQYNQVYL